MNLELEISNISIIIAVVFRLVAAIIFLAFIIPLQIKQVQVKNGLRKLRYELLTTGIVIFLINTVGLGLVAAKFFVSPEVIQRLTDILTILNTAGFLTVAIIQFNVYHHRYTPEQKKLHEEFNKMELAAEKVAQKKKREKEAIKK